MVTVIKSNSSKPEFQNPFHSKKQVLSSTSQIRKKMKKKRQPEQQQPIKVDEVGTNKRGKIIFLEEKVKSLEEENIRLKSQLRVGKEPVSLDEQAKQQLTDKIDDMVNSGAPDKDIKVILKEYVIRFSDYGTDRSKIVAKHMDQLDHLLAPTQISKLCMWSLHQDDEFFRSTSAESPDYSLWAKMCKEIEATPEQQEQFKKYRENAVQLTRELRFTNRECQELRKKLSKKNQAFGTEMAELSAILTPTQMARFVLFVSKNPASAAMLNRLWESELKRVIKASSVANSNSTASSTMFSPQL
jgi:hypothetical protein